MNIAIVGTGYVGLVTGTCFSEMGINVACVDVDVAKIENLRRGVIPIYEPGLDELVKKNTARGRLTFHTDLAQVINHVEVVFIAVGTPPDEDGSADLKYVLAVARSIGSLITRRVVVVTKSTVPVGTSEMVRKAINDELERRGVSVEFDIASNPEFLKEGAAIKDFMSPDRIVVGVDNERARRVMARLYKPFMVVSDRMIFTDIASAEMIKYAANSMLATRISFMNDIANLCSLVGADVNMVRRGIGSDTRIGTKFLYPGIGYGGSCFPKDVKALIHTAAQHGYDMRVLRAVEQVNNDQKRVLFDAMAQHYGGIENLNGLQVAMWGLAFKPETDDMREAPSLVLINLLLDAGATVRVYDPIAMTECRRLLGDKVTYCTDMYEATHGADALILATEWKEFRVPNVERLQELMRGKAVFDGRNILDAAELQQAGFFYRGIGVR